jgi:hypothetical protein
MANKPVKTDIPCQCCGDTDTWIFDCCDGQATLCLKCAWPIACIIHRILNAGSMELRKGAKILSKTSGWERAIHCE